MSTIPPSSAASAPPSPGSLAPPAPKSPTPDSMPPRPVAPVWHTIVLAAFFLGLAAAGAVFQRAATLHPGVAQRPPQVLPLYISLIVGEWGLVLYVWRGGLRRRGTALRDVIGGRWGSARDVVLDVAVAVGLWGGAMLLLAGLDRLLGAGHAASISGFLPRGVLESGLWLLLSLSAGFCEELVYRGYFMRQFAAWTRSAWIGLVLQAVLFGVSHGYQGVTACVRIAAYGALFGLVALWRRSLRPGMIAHALTDILGGIFRI